MPNQIKVFNGSTYKFLMTRGFPPFEYVCDVVVNEIRGAHGSSESMGDVRDEQKKLCN